MAHVINATIATGVLPDRLKMFKKVFKSENSKVIKTLLSDVLIKIIFFLNGENVMSLLQIISTA